VEQLNSESGRRGELEIITNKLRGFMEILIESFYDAGVNSLLNKCKTPKLMFAQLMMNI
jgi:hypothetical protein